MIIGFINKDSLIGKEYELRKSSSLFYKQAKFYSVEKVSEEMRNAGFHDIVYSQTLFEDLDQINKFEFAKPGYGEGSFVVVKAVKR